MNKAVKIKAKNLMYLRLVIEFKGYESRFIKQFCRMLRMTGIERKH